MADRGEKENLATEFQALGVSAYNRAMDSVGSAANKAAGLVSSMLGVINPLNLALGALGTVGAVLSGKAIGDLGGKVENTQAQMAGLLNAFEFSTDFNEGLELAEATMRKINAAAALLPGEAEDYVEVFTAGLPNLQASVGGTLGEMTDFSNKYTAIMKSAGVSTSEAALGLRQMLAPDRGQTVERNRAFSALLPMMKAVEGQSNLNSKAFNALDKSARVDAMAQAMQKMEPMVEHQAHSWDAVTGAIASASKLLTRITTAPMFEAMKSSISLLASTIMDSKGEFTDFAFILSEIGKVGFGGAGGMLESITNKFENFTNNFGNILLDVADSGWVHKLEAAYGELIRSMGPAIALWDAATASISDATDMFVDAMADNMKPIGTVVGQLADIMLQALPTALALFLAAVKSVGLAFEGVAWLLDGFRATLDLAKIGWDTIGHQFDRLIVTLSKFDIFLGGRGSSLYGKVEDTPGYGDATAPKISGVALWNKIRQERFDQGEKNWGAVSGWVEKILASAKQARDDADKKAKAADVTGKKPPNPNMDFRNSRFTIEQKFAENFDPDRIAVAFARDVGKIGSQKLSSGFEPLYGIR